MGLEVHDRMTLLAIHGFLEYFFLGLLVFLLGAVGLFAVFLLIQLVRNPGRPVRRP
jgi:hypothetical protein